MKPPQSPALRTVADLEDETVALIGGSGNVYCSGVWVSNNEIVTAAHCTRKLDIGDLALYTTRNDVSVTDADEVEAIRLARLVARDMRHDLALLRVKLPPEHQTARISRQAPAAGEFSQSMGHPLGNVWSYSTGVVAAVRVLDEGEGNAWWVQSTAPISPGNSGGGLFDHQGELIGICHAYMPDGENLNIYIYPSYIYEFIKKNGIES